MAKIKKDCTIDPQNYDYIMQTMEEEDLGSFSAALNWIIKEQREAASKEDAIANKVIDQLNQQHYDLFGRLRRNINAADFNTQVILEILNTMVINLGITQSYPTTEVKADALLAGEEEVKKKIAYFKQVKDNGKYKKNKYK